MNASATSGNDDAYRNAQARRTERADASRLPHPVALRHAPLPSVTTDRRPIPTVRSTERYRMNPPALSASARGAARTRPPADAAGYPLGYNRAEPHRRRSACASPSTISAATVPRAALLAGYARAGDRPDARWPVPWFQRVHREGRALLRLRYLRPVLRRRRSLVQVGGEPWPRYLLKCSIARPCPVAATRAVEAPRGLRRRSRRSSPPSSSAASAMTPQIAYLDIESDDVRTGTRAPARRDRDQGLPVSGHGDRRRPRLRRCRLLPGDPSCRERPASADR